jgi:hypothetical protein
MTGSSPVMTRGESLLDVMAGLEPAIQKDRKQRRARSHRLSLQRSGHSFPHACGDPAAWDALAPLTIIWNDLRDTERE